MLLLPESFPTPPRLFHSSFLHFLKFLLKWQLFQDFSGHCLT